MKASYKKIGQESKRNLLNEYRDDIHLAYDDGDVQEYWIGINGTTSLKMLVWSEGYGDLFDFGKTNDELRKDEIFAHAIVDDADVNHSINCDGKGGYYLTDEYCVEVVDWLIGKALEPPITACGVVNYFNTYFRLG